MNISLVIGFIFAVQVSSGEWKSWSFGSYAPASDGVLAGYTERQEASFIGRAYHEGQLVIGKLVIDAYARGLYLPWGGKEFKKTDGIEYYAKDSDCNYNWEMSSNGRRVNDAIGFNSQQYTFYVGRTYQSNSVQVGKVTLELNQLLYGYAGVETGASNYEVLVCTKKVPEKKKIRVTHATAHATTTTESVTFGSKTPIFIGQLETTYNNH